MGTEKLSRRDFLRMSTLAAAGAALAGCAQPTPEVIREEVEVEVPVEVTRIIEREGETIVEEVVVTATPPPAEPVTVFFTFQGDIGQFDPVVRDVTKEKFPNINVEMDVTPWGDLGWASFANNLLTRLAGGEQLDIIHTGIEPVRLLAWKNIYIPLDDFLATDPVKADLEEDIHPILFECVRWKGEQWQLPFGWNNMLIHYNYKILEEVGLSEPNDDWSWQDFLEVSKAVARVEGGEDDRYAFNIWGGVPHSVWRRGASAITPPT